MLESRSFVRSVVVALTAFIGICAAPFCWAQAAQSFPSKPIRLIVPFAPGGATDTLARTVARQFTAHTGAAVVVENKPGGSGAIGLTTVAKASPDGYTILWGSDSALVQPLLRKDSQVDLMKDLTPLAGLGIAPAAISVNKDLPVNSVKELVALARAKPGSLHYGSGGTATNLHLIGEEFNLLNSIAMEHIPYQGTGPAVVDTLAGSIEVVFSGVNEVAKHAAAGNIRVLAVTSRGRIASLPQVPTMIESGYSDYVAGSWMSVHGPAGLPAAVASYLSKNLIAAAQSPKFRELAEKLGMELNLLDGAETAAFMKTHYARYRTSIIKSGIKVE